MLEVGFLCPKSGKEMEKRRLARKKNGFRAQRNRPEANHF